MTERLYVTMMCAMLLWPMFLVSGALTLSIDSHLGTSIEDCFERVAIGEQLPSNAIYRNVSELTTRECEQICRQDKQCQAYDYGVGAKGNATCNLSNLSEKEIYENTPRFHPDYDIYIRRLQCEQSPPSPLIPLFDDPGEGPAHRPVFRPEDEDQKIPEFEATHADFTKPSDVMPYSSFSKPDRRPYYNNYYDVPYRKPYRIPYKDSYYDPHHNYLDNDRPDDYQGQKPELDQQIGYGPHQPQDIPFHMKPKPSYSQNQSSFRPKPKPDPFDELHFEDYGRPPRPVRPSHGYWRPNPYLTSTPEFDGPGYGQNPTSPYMTEETPNYHYFTRPTKKPTYAKPSETYKPSYLPQDTLEKPEYGQTATQTRPPKRPYKPYPNYESTTYKPFLKPSYSYTSQYGSIYGQTTSSYNQDNYIYVEINDPPRPYHSHKPSHDRPDPGYGSDTNEQDSGYGSNSHSSQNTFIKDPPTPNYPSKPSNDLPNPAYGSGTSAQDQYSLNSHSTQNSFIEDPSRPYRPNSFSHDRPDPNYANDQEQADHGYGNSQSSHSHGTESSHTGGPYRPNYGGHGQKKPSYSSQSAAYGSQSLYSESQHYSGQSYHGYHRPSFDQPTYGSQQAYESDNQAYGSPATYGNTSQYGPHQSSYGSSQTSSNYAGFAYGQGHLGYGTYGLDKPSYSGRPYQSSGSYALNYGPGTPSYESERPDGDAGYETLDQGYRAPGKGNDTQGPSKPLSVKPVYENDLDHPSSGLPSYVSKPNGQVITSRPVVISDYGVRRPSKRPSYEACFRRVLAGKRALRSHVRRVVPCERLEDCRQECAEERRFHCESFNYRLDPSFRGKGLCELMTKPIEAFDIRRDFVEDKNFDFFELDRNSLEPHCPETWRGPGLLHSGFLSSKPPADEGGYKGYDWNRNRLDERYEDERRGGGYGNRRYEEEAFIPYQIGISRSNEDQGSWGQYGGQYGGNGVYYKDQNDFKTSSDHWHLTPKDKAPYPASKGPDFSGIKPHTVSSFDFDYHSLGTKKFTDDRSDSYGHAYKSWKKGYGNSSGHGTTGLDYGESSYYKPVGPSYEEARIAPDDVKDCTLRRKAGMALSSGAIRRSLLALTVVDCESACFNEREFKCVSYSYRYSNAAESDNCFLSERPYRGVEVSSDTSSDVYAMPHEEGCVTSHKPWVESECFWHVRSGSAVSGPAIKAALTVAGLGACEAECIRAHAFFCRGFSFRYEAPVIGDELENCLLTSLPPTSLEPDNGSRPTPGHEMYARGNYGRGCEPALYDELHHKETQCYLQYDKASKLIGPAIKGRARAKDELSCGFACTDAPFTCLSFSFNNAAPPDTENCLLSEIRLFDLQLGVDYEHSADDWLFAFDLFNGQCWRKVQGKDHDRPSSEVPHPIPPPTDLSAPGHDHQGGSKYAPSAPGDSGYHHHSDGPSGSSYQPGSGPPSSPGYTYTHTYPSGPPATRPYVPETGHGFQPAYPPTVHQPAYPPQGYQPGYRPTPEPGYLAEPGYKPAYPPTGYQPAERPGHRPVYPQEPPVPEYIPSYPEGNHGFTPAYPPPEKPSYRPETDPYPAYVPGRDPNGPGYRPEYPVSRPEYPSIRPEHPSNRPEYPPSRPEYPSSRPDYSPNLPDYPSSRPGYSHRPEYPIGPTIRPERPSPPTYGGSRPSGGSSYGNRPSYPPGPSGPSYGSKRPPTQGYGPGDRVDETPASWQHYTVSGFPCRANTACAQNVVAGHWACEPEGGEIGSWDYCCAPNHRCGYSEGFHKPWCYVGTSEEQWRPCSEKYYPYHQHNVPHPSQGHRGERPHLQPEYGSRRAGHRPGSSTYLPSGEDRRKPNYSPGPYLPEADRKYWDDLYKNGPQAYYDKYGNPLPGYTRVPMTSHPEIHYHSPDSSYRPDACCRTSLDSEETQDPPVPGGLGAPRYWPVAYLHKGPPPNITYFKYNETDKTTTTTTEKYDNRSPINLPNEKPASNFDRRLPEKDDDIAESRSGQRSEKNRNISRDNEFELHDSPNNSTASINETTSKPDNVKKNESATNVTEIDAPKAEKFEAKEEETMKGISGKLDDFSGSIEVFNIEDAKSGDKPSDIKAIEAEEKQIEAIGRLLASRRGGKLVLEKRSQKDLEARNIAVDKDLFGEFDFSNKFATTERRGIIQKVSKDQIDLDRQRNNDKSLEVSETTFVRPPRVLSTTESIRKALINGKVFYDATVREQRDLFPTIATRRNSTHARLLDNSRKNTTFVKALEESKAPSVIASQGFGIKKTIRARNVNPVRRVRRIYRKRYDPEEVRKRLLERDRSKMELESIAKL